MADSFDSLEGDVARSPATTLDVSAVRVWGLPCKVDGSPTAEGGRIADLAVGKTSNVLSPGLFALAESVKALRRRAK